MPEVELKFAIAPGAHRDFARLRALGSAKPARQKLYNLYFDTPRLALAGNHMALRLRRSDRQWSQALKAGRSGTGGLHSRGEWEFERAGPRLDLELFADTPLAQVEGAAALHRTLRPAFEATFTRTTWILAPNPGQKLEVALDAGTVRSNSGSEDISEVEIECLEGDATAAFDLAARLVAEMALRPSAITKAQRGYRLWKAERLRPAKAVDIELDPGMSLATAARAVVGAAIEQLQANEEGVLGTEDPEFVHQARVALRRTRSALRMFRDVIGAERARAWRSALDEASGTLGAARDWDVFAVSLAAATRAHGDRSTARSLRVRVTERRRREREAAREALGSVRYARVMLELSRWLAGAAGDDPKTKEPLTRFAARVIRKRRKRLVAGALLLATLTMQERHRVRIAAKRLRYAVDPLASLFGSRRVKPFLASVASLQDALGEANDAATAGVLLDEIDAPEPFAAFARGWFAARARGDALALEPVVADIALTRRFWRKH
jgi:inorganic triphosphatase YgiF